MHRLLFISCISLLGVAPSIAQVLPSVSEHNREAAEILNRPITAEIHEMRFADFLVFFSQETGLQCLVSDSARDNQLDEDSLITISMSRVRRSSFLDFMLEPYQCTYLVRDGVLMILSYEEAQERLSLRVYDCSELLATVKGKEVVRHEFNENSRKSTRVMLTPSERLTELIIEFVDPDSWEVNGGSARIQEVNGLLVVRQTEQNLLEIGRLLDHLTAKSQNR